MSGVSGGVSGGSTSTGRRVRWVIALSLIAIGLAVIAGALLRQRSTGAEFEAGQQELAEAWDAPLIISDSTTPTAGTSTPDDPVADETADEPTPVVGSDTHSADVTGDAPRPTAGADSTPANTDPEFAPVPLAALEFRRPGDDRAPVTSSRLFVVDNVTEQALTRGPGHYPSTAGPGKVGNFAVAGHRTGWGAPFYSLDELKKGDEVVVTDRRGRKFVYVVDRSERVAPNDDWVLGPDPLRSGDRTLTLTTCDPPGVNTKRLVVFGTLSRGSA